MKRILLGITLIALTGTAFADTPARYDTRENRQANRIAAGVATGQLTVKETHGLVHQQAGIRRTERRFESDGVVTAGERIRLERRQDRASRNIYRQKHDRQRRH